MGKKLFDYVIGNPPYQEDTSDSTRKKPIYNASVRVWEYPNKPFPRKRECVPKARVGQGNIACQLAR